MYHEYYNMEIIQMLNNDKLDLITKLTSTNYIYYQLRLQKDY